MVVGNFGHTKVAVKRSLCKEQLATEAHFLFLCQSHFVVKLLHCEPGLLALEFCLPLPVGKQVNVKNLLAGLFSGLAHVHSLSVAHRDIKMENILQAPFGALKLADFGCASKGANGRFFETAGSFKCWAPEMIELADRGYCGFAADVWAAGVVSHELICGKYPFRGRTGRGISIRMMKANILAGPVASDPDWNGSRERNFVLAVLRPDPNERLPSALAAKMIGCVPFHLPARKRRWTEPGSLA